MLLKKFELILRNLAFATGSVLATLLFLNTFGLQTWFVQGREIEPLVFYFTGSGMALVSLAFGAFFCWVVVCICIAVTHPEMTEGKSGHDAPESPG